MQSRVLGLAVSAALFAASPAAAITVTETVAGDFRSNPSFPTDLGELNLGLNSISGSLDAICIDTPLGPRPDCTDFEEDAGDVFVFTIPDGAELVSAILTISDLSKSGRGTPFALGESEFELVDIGAVDNGVYDILGAAALVGQQGYGISAVLRDSEEFATFQANWSVELTVAAIPLPASSLLLLSGVAGLGLTLRRRRGG